MNIKIKTLNGQIINVYVQNDNSINEIKNQIQEMEGINPDYLRIFCNGLLLDPNAKIKDLDINQHSTLHLILALRGG